MKPRIGIFERVHPCTLLMALNDSEEHAEVSSAKGRPDDKATIFDVARA